MLLGVVTALCVLLGGALVAHHYAPLYAPELVMTWSPSADHISRAFVRRHYSPAGIYPERATAVRCSNADLMRLFRSGPAGAFRAAFILGPRVDHGSIIDPQADQSKANGWSASVTVRELIASEPPDRVAELVNHLPSGHPETIDLVGALIDHPHPMLALAATRALYPSHGGARILPPPVIEALCRELAYRSRCRHGEVALIATNPAWDGFRHPTKDAYILGYRPAPALRSATPNEINTMEMATIDAAWNALSLHRPDLAGSEARRQWESLSDVRRSTIVERLGYSDERAVSFLFELAGRDGKEAEAAVVMLATLCYEGTHSVRGGCGSSEAFLAVVDWFVHHPGRRPAGVDAHLRRTRFRPSEMARIAERLTTADRQTLALQMLKPEQADALRASLNALKATQSAASP